MKLFSRFSATVLAGVDKTVSHIENHDAVIEASLKETQRAAARARVRLQRVMRDGESLLSRQKLLKKNTELWATRARDYHETDRTLALQCVARWKQCIAEEQELQTVLSKHEKMQQKLTQSIASIEKRAIEMSQQRNQMRSRESTAEALRIMSRVEGIDTSGIDDTFERWDLSISETEIDAGVPFQPGSADVLDEQFNTLEIESGLEAELDALVANAPSQAQGGEQ